MFGGWFIARVAGLKEKSGQDIFSFFCQLTFYGVCVIIFGKVYRENLKMVNKNIFSAFPLQNEGKNWGKQTIKYATGF